MTGLFESQAPRPLADRLRPKRLEEVVGQQHLLAADAPIGRMVASGHISSMILWGPPGCGKTTLARLLAEHTSLHFEPLSAVFSGVADLRKIFEAARSAAEETGSLMPPKHILNAPTRLMKQLGYSKGYE
ncbi:MAG: AAA family ATPase, partial [Dongiales bacterium]